MSDLTHQNENGELSMVDVGDKNVTERIAKAQGRVYLKKAFDPIKHNQLKKGSALECARLAGILAAKNTAHMIPLCHNLIMDHIAIEFEFIDDYVQVTSEIRVHGKTGAEMEALTAVSVACLTIYDMAKAVEKEMVISSVRLISKSGGKSGNWQASD